jgi:hypothetical protein
MRRNEKNLYLRKICTERKAVGTEVNSKTLFIYASGLCKT